jgi:hypothetical protein
MEKENNRGLVEALWNAFDRQKWQEASSLFVDNAAVYWPVTDELFDKAGFIAANKDYPGKWSTKLLRYDDIPGGGVSTAQVTSQESPEKFFVTSYYEFDSGKILKIREYWSSAMKAPEWRKKYWKN